MRTQGADWVSAAGAPEEVLEIIAKRQATATLGREDQHPITIAFVPAAGGVGQDVGDIGHDLPIVKQAQAAAGDVVRAAGDCEAVKAGLGIAVIDQFTVAHGGYPGIELLRIVEPTRFDTYIAVKRGAPLSLHIEHFIECLRSEMRAVGPGKAAPRKPDSKPRRK
jgi:DNA-binding transcriptional LysR family regulator